MTKKRGGGVKHIVNKMRSQRILCNIYIFYLLINVAFLKSDEISCRKKTFVLFMIRIQWYIQFLTQCDLGRVGRVCKKWNDIHIFFSVFWVYLGVLNWSVKWLYMWVTVIVNWKIGSNLGSSYAQNIINWYIRTQGLWYLLAS